jgi:antitoxin HigA-1
MARTAIHPGEILADELEELGLTSAELARTIDVPANRISQIIAGKRNITADTRCVWAAISVRRPTFG